VKPRHLIPIVSLFTALILSALWAEDAQQPTSNLDPLVQLLTQVDDANFQLDLLRGIHDAVKGRRKITMPKNWPVTAKKLAKSTNAEVREKTTLLSVIFGDPQALAALRKVVSDSKSPADERQTALSALAQNQDKALIPLLIALVEKPTLTGTDAQVRGPALRGLAAYNALNTPTVILARYAKFTEAEKCDAINTLASRPSYALQLLTAIEKKQVPSRDLSAFTARQLLGLNNKSITKRLNQVWGTTRATSKDKADLIAQYKRKLTGKELKKADKSHGRLVFSRTCAACHLLFGEGKKIGPDLTGSQRANLDYVLQNVLDPNAVVGRDYQMSVIVNDQGRIVTGIIAEENENTVTVLTPTGKVIIPKNEIEARKRSPLSMMPEGMIAKLNPEEFRDLVAYLASPLQVDLPKSDATSKER